jgi:hypothetical protein
MKLTKEQMLMVNGALAEYRVNQTDTKLWTNSDEKNYQRIVLQLRRDYKEAVQGVKNGRVKNS